ncbi:hypothetical protein BMG00_11210 [Thioclava marina]|uniref:Uncharacterized protein n=1 Tax=Thioclava marina TaxID=1915077 RepID=A0ABX3MKF6_9RHOB|nr:hypothetical protein [Thioclava marina]OOY11663.1 hypothetical protein BMG00_11210 [Thioclava marina]
MNDASNTFELLSGAQALRALARDLSEHGAGEPLSAETRDHLIFVMKAMADRTEASASAWIDALETGAAA